MATDNQIRPRKVTSLRTTSPSYKFKIFETCISCLFAYYAKWIKQFSEKIKRLKEAKSLPLNDSQISDFQNLKKEIAIAAFRSIDENMLFVVECDASDVAILATLNQEGRLVVLCQEHCMEANYIIRLYKKKQLVLLKQFKNGLFFSPDSTLPS